MRIKLLSGLLLCLVLQTSSGQQITSLKIEEVVKSITADNDTTYVVNFWATFCKPCIAEIPHFIRLVNKYKTQKVKLLLVSLDLPSYYPGKIKAFAKKNSYNTNIAWLNETNADHFCPMIDPQWSGAIPATIIVNNKTGFRKFTEDQISAKDFEASLKEAIGGVTMNSKYILPMKDAALTDNFNKFGCATFKSEDSSVFAITGGKVSKVVRIESIKVIIIEKDSVFYTYSNLGSILLKKDDEVKAGQLIGYAAFDLNKEKPTVDLFLRDSTKRLMLAREDFVAQ